MAHLQGLGADNMVRITSVVVVLLLCGVLGRMTDFDLPTVVVNRTSTTPPDHFYPGTGFSLQQCKTLIGYMQDQYASDVPHIKAMSFESLALQSSQNVKASCAHYETLYRHVRDAEQSRLSRVVVPRTRLRGAAKRQLLEDEEHRSLTKKAKYLEACVRAKCTKGQQCSSVGTCQSCKIGTFAAAEFVLRCAECPSGTHGTEAIDKDATEACTACPVGFYANKKAQAECTPCEPGKFQNTPGATGCVNANMPADLDLCNDTHFFPEGATDVGTATKPLARNGAECPSSKTGKDGLPKWAVTLLCVLAGFIGACFARSLYWCLQPPARS